MGIEFLTADFLLPFLILITESFSQEKQFSFHAMP